MAAGINFTDPEPTMELKKLTPNIIVADVNASIDFYATHLGFAVIASVPESGKRNWAMLTSGEVTIMLQSLESAHEEVPSFNHIPSGPHTAILYIDVTDVRALYERMKGHAPLLADIHTTFYGTTEFSVTDPDGYALAFAQDTK